MLISIMYCDLGNVQGILLLYFAIVIDSVDGAFVNGMIVTLKLAAVPGIAPCSYCS